MKLWLDDVRQAPSGYEWVRSVDEAKALCEEMLASGKVLDMEIIDLDHDAGDYASMGGDYIEFLNWLEQKKAEEGWIVKAFFTYHSANPVGISNMSRIVRHNGWKEI